MSPPRCFISYSWDSEPHRAWVRKLATRMRECGIEAILDQWHCSPGIDLAKFMEKSVRESSFVLLVCTPAFAQKADSGSGGVGYEKAIVTGEIFIGNAGETKFIPLLREGEAKQSLPSYLKSRLFVDFREDAFFENRLEELLRHFYREPLYPPPPVGPKPDFIRASAPVETEKEGPPKESHIERNVEPSKTKQAWHAVVNHMRSYAEKFTVAVKRTKAITLTTLLIIALPIIAYFLRPPQDKPQTVHTDYSMDLAHWGIKNYRPSYIDLSEQRLANNWIEPTSKGIKRLYGILMFGSKTKVGVIVDLLENREAQIVFDFDGDSNFTNETIYRTARGKVPNPIEFQIDYPDDSRQAYTINAGISGSADKSQLRYWSACIRQGIIKLGGANYPIALQDGDGDGQYSNLNTTELLIDSSRERGAQAKRLSAAFAFPIEGTYYIISDISPSGKTVTVAPAKYGEIVGRVLNADTGAPLSEVNIMLSPNEISAVTGPDGRYHVKAPEGEYRHLSALAKGFANFYTHVDKRLNAEQSMTVNVPLFPSRTGSARSGFIRLSSGDSYDFLNGRQFYGRGGDFAVSISNNEAHLIANVEGQKGIIDLGNIGIIPLNQIEAPSPANYDKQVVAVPGHTYISPAKAGEEGHYIIFRVIGLKVGDSVEAEFYYH